MLKQPKKLIEGNPVLLVIDVQQGCYMPPPKDRNIWMPGYRERMDRVPGLIEEARKCNVPVIFFQEEHRRNMIDFGRELDGTEDVHCLEGEPGTPVAEQVGMRPDDYFIRKRRYSCFFGTELEILLKGLRADTLIMVGGFTDVCIHYTFVDAHQHDYYCRVVEDCVGGSSTAAHEAALNAVEYLQTGARRLCDEVIEAFREYAARQQGNTPPGDTR